MFCPKGVIFKKIWEFRVNNSRPIETPIKKWLVLCLSDYWKTNEEKNHMGKAPYANEIGSLKDALLCTRPNISFIIAIITQFHSSLRLVRWQELSKTFRYLCGNHISCLLSWWDLNLVGFCDTDWVTIKMIESPSQAIHCYMYIFCENNFSSIWISIFQHLYHSYKISEYIKYVQVYHL